MLDKDMTKRQIEEALKGKGDFVQIDYLTRFIESSPPIDLKKASYLKLAEIYESKKMFEDAGRALNNAALSSIAFSEKIKHYVKEAELYIKAGRFNEVDEALKKAMRQANSAEKENIYLSVKEFYKKQAEVYIQENRRNNAVRIYEKLLQMKISDDEREETKEKLLGLYEKLGKVQDYFKLKDG